LAMAHAATGHTAPEKAPVKIKTDIPDPQLEVALQYARLQPKWKKYVDDPVPPPKPDTMVADGAKWVGFVVGGHIGYYIMHKGWVKRPERIRGFQSVLTGYKLRPLTIHPFPFHLACMALGAGVAQWWFGRIYKKRRVAWREAGLPVPP